MQNLKNSKLVFPALVTLALILLVVLDKIESGLFERVIFTIFVLDVWVIGLCLHEFAHAYSAYKFGDNEVAQKGYLTLNPLLYGNAATSFIYPIIILLIGGLPLPGGAVYLDHSKIKTKFEIALTYLCGPLANLFFGIGLGLIYLAMGRVEHDGIIDDALTLSAFLQFYTFIFNLLPLPGFDGFGALSIYFNPEFRAKMLKLSALMMVGLLIAVFYFPGVFFVLQRPAVDGIQMMGMNIDALMNGFDNFISGAN